MGRESPGWGEGRRLDERASEWAGCYPCLPCLFWDWGGGGGACACAAPSALEVEIVIYCTQRCELMRSSSLHYSP